MNERVNEWANKGGSGTVKGMEEERKGCRREGMGMKEDEARGEQKEGERKEKEE